VGFFSFSLEGRGLKAIIKICNMMNQKKPDRELENKTYICRGDG
jgi:hypothetical protein